MIRGEMSAKTTYQRSAKGPVSISECSADGTYVALENTGRKVGKHSSSSSSNCSFVSWPLRLLLVQHDFVDAHVSYAPSIDLPEVRGRAQICCAFNDL